MFNENKGLIFHIQRFVLHDGPGIRTTVFLKGCPLKCPWCHNPEGLEPYPELIYRSYQCIHSRKCIGACPENAIKLINNEISIDRTRCNLCDICNKACNSNALEICGQYMTVKELISEILADLEFYKQSKGGLTISGGEPLMQREFLINLLKEANKAEIHTCLDTTGYIYSEKLKEVIKNVDLLLYDVKTLDKNRHEILTGVSNVLILDNLKLCISENIDTIIRIPIIPGYNFVEVEKELSESVEWLVGLGIKKFELIPYHKFGEQKYKMLGKSYNLKVESLDKNIVLNLAKELSKNFGIAVQVSIPLIT